MNKVILCGRITANPELRHVKIGDSEVAVSNFDVAVNEKVGTKKRTDFFRVTVWRGLAETCCKYLKKGQRINVEGSVHLSVATVKDKTYSGMEIQATNVEFLDMPNETTNPIETEESNEKEIKEINVTEHKNQQQQYKQNEPVIDDDLPF